MITSRLGLGAAVALAILVGGVEASASPFTRTSPTGGTLPGAVTEIGGVVMDFKGLNGTRIVTEAAASSLYVGYAGSNPFSFGSQGGFTPAVIAALGGGLASASVRITLFDGDTQAGNFDFNANTLKIGSSYGNAANFGDWSASATQETTSNGLTVLSSGFGYGNNILSTGFFSTTNATELASLYSGIQTGSVSFFINDLTPYDNFYDFTQGVNGSLINVGTGPVINPGVPEPSTWAMMLLGLVGLGFVGRRKADRMIKAA